MGTRICCINVRSTSNFDVDDVLKRCWISKLDRRRRCIYVAASMHFRRRSYVVFTLNATSMTLCINLYLWLRHIRLQCFILLHLLIDDEAELCHVSLFSS